MATPNAALQAFAQSIYLVIKNRYYDDITSEDGVVYINQVIDWTNQFLDELETETNPDGSIIDWNWVREINFTLGLAVAGQASIELDTDVNNLIAGENRYVQILQDGSSVSNWAVVSPAEISNRKNRITQDMVSVIGSQIIFSRVLQDFEDGGTITGDVTVPLPRLSLTNQDILSTVKPKQLLILGVAKNATLPDIVQGGLSPSYTQKFNDLLQGAIARNSTSALSDLAQTDDFSSIRGIY